MGLSYGSRSAVWISIGFQKSCMGKQMCPRWGLFPRYCKPLAGARFLMGSSSGAFIGIGLHSKMKGVGNKVCNQDVDNTP